ncbi:patatin-like phospholipase family protein [Nocardioides pocheonensis]|uniref:patatin-like phospholipase family protein n=1 Tax=Nocardioides pocheonensis TaxID=661485 RepID=UPI001FE76B10|nr:patatin-like phospholipase family protein [Nocardioides pocheonensis]
MRVALALGSGGARGYAHIGVINELQERGHEIVAVAGSSMGALVGGVFAAGELASYTEWVLGLSQRSVLRQMDPALASGGVIRADRVLGSMAELVGDRRIESLPIRYTAVAVDLLAGREVWLDEGPLDRAIRASIGIPGVIAPTAVNGRILVDGGVLNPVPVAATATARADLVVAVSLQGPRGRQPYAPTRESAERRPVAEWWERFRSNAAGILSSDAVEAVAQRLPVRRTAPDVPEADVAAELVATADPATADGAADVLPSVSMRDVVSLSLDAAQSALTRYSLAAHPPDLLITVPKDACRTLDFHRAAELIDLGRTLAREALDREAPEDDPEPGGTQP